MTFYYRGSRGGREEPPTIDWDEVLKREPPDLRRPILITVAIILLWIFLSIAPRLYTDYRWFEELGYTSVFSTEWSSRITTFLIAGAVFFLFYVVNITIARRLTPRVTDESSRWSQIVAFAGRSVNFLLITAGLFLAIVVGLIAQAEWLMFQRFLHAVPFNTSDPVFNQDVSFYVFTLPVYEFLIGWLGGVLILTMLAVGVTYALGIGQLRWTNAVKSHLSALGFGLLLLSAWNYQLQIYSLVYSARGVVFGASYTDVNAQWPAYNVLTFITLALAALLLVNIFVRALKGIGVAVALWIAAWILLGQFYPGFVQSFDVKPNEFTREQPYIRNNIALTRKAYGLDTIQESAYPAEDSPTTADVQRNATAINNIRLWDYRPLLQTYDQIQTIRTYYDFGDIDVDRYTIDGRYQQVMVSARELTTSRLPENAQTWVNLRLLYTHGYGVAMTPVNEFTLDGLPTLIVKDIPPAGKVPITRPEIYYGEQATSYVFVKTKEKEFDYPKGDENALTTYAGTGGVPINSYFDRLMFSLRFADTNILLTDAFTGDSRVLFNRTIQSRIARIAPFLMLDRDPYIVVADGRLVWLQDAYTSTDRYPYSEPHESGINYIRNSVKIAVDAYDGTVVFYVAEPNEPILQAYRAIFPVLFRSMDQMPAALSAHIRYPEGLFSIQAAMYRTYHMQDPQVFYNKEDLWAIPNENLTGQAQPMEPYYVILRLPGETTDEFTIMLPFAPARRQNMIAWLSVKSDGADYGKQLVYRFPKDKLIYGPEQISARVNQNPAISSQLTLLNQRGSRIIFGNLLVIPVEKSLLYVQPLYLLAEQSQIPQLKYVIVATGTTLSMQPTLGEALAQIFTGIGTPTAATPPTAPGTVTTAPPATSPTDATVAALAKEANDHYARAQDALKSADWATYGKEMQALQQVLGQLIQVTGQK
ncbi:MAG: UPF0182 family protein [Chloroflexi bacterium]|nr:UPF0182 family protein [Chloroflexota bacterium]